LQQDAAGSATGIVLWKVVCGGTEKHVIDHLAFGQPSDAIIQMADMVEDIHTAMADEPSIYREGIERFGYGFHHVAIPANDFAQDQARVQEQCFETVMTGIIGGTSIHYAHLEKADSVPGYLELVRRGIANAAMVPMYRETLGWNGKDPIRRLKIAA
jgi:hypothetical protein